MNDLLFVLIGIVVMSNFIYTLWSFFSLRRAVHDIGARRTDDRFQLENFVHSRSSLNLVYASIAIMAFVLGFFGLNVQKNVTSEVKKEIADAARIDLDSLKAKSDNISLLESFARQNSNEMTKLREQSRLLLENMRRIPQKLYVIEALPISKQKHTYLFSELQPVDGTKLPQFSKPPMVLWYAYEVNNKGSSYGTNVVATTHGIEVYAYDVPYVIDIWIYLR